MKTNVSIVFTYGRKSLSFQNKGKRAWSKIQKCHEIVQKSYTINDKGFKMKDKKALS